MTVEIKDSGSGFFISRPRLVGLVFLVAASPVFFGLASLGHKTLGVWLYVATYLGLIIAYVTPTPVRRFMQELIPTSAEKAERATATRPEKSAES